MTLRKMRKFKIINLSHESKIQLALLLITLTISDFENEDKPNMQENDYIPTKKRKE